MPSRLVRDARLLSLFLLCKGTAKKFGKQENIQKSDLSHIRVFRKIKLRSGNRYSVRIL